MTEDPKTDPKTEDQTPESDPGDLLYCVWYNDQTGDPEDPKTWERLTENQVRDRLSKNYKDMDQILQYLDSGKTLYTTWSQYRRLGDLD